MDNNRRRTPAEVAADASVEHTGKGVLNQMKGNVKEAWGKLTDNPKTKLEGKIDRVKGSAQEKLGEFEAKEARLESGGDLDDTDPSHHR
jgi:uncharacterized protein YjbJ (UPF0337 family)